MIAGIKLKNWEAHRNLEAKFTPALNLIVGRTDAGKSSVLRALSWVARHEPLKQGTITHGEDSLRVGVKTEAGAVVRFKDSTGYGYKAAGETFLACATNQPLAVGQILNLAPINICLQDDPPYLINLTPGALAQAVNEIVDLASIDKCVSWLKSQRTRTRTLAEAATAKEKALAEQLVSLEWAAEAQEAYSRLQSTLERHERLIKRNSGLQGVLDTLEAAERLTGALLPLQEALEEHCAQASIVQGNLHRAKTRKQALTSILAELAACSGLGELEAYGIDLGALRKLEDKFSKTSTKAGNIEQLTGAIKTISPKISQFRELEAALLCMIASYKTTSDTMGKVASLRVTLNMVKESANEMQQLATAKKAIEEKMGVCPECGKPL